MVDVVIFCEGTYPYVSGGVSSWIHALITGMPDLTFGLVFLAPTRNFKRDFKYKLPANVKEFVEIYIYDVAIVDRPPTGDSRAAWKSVEKFFNELADGQVADLEKLLPHLTPGMRDLAYSRQSWDILLRSYHRLAPDLSFVDYFWTWRFIHFPLFQLLNAPIPEAKVYHTVTTGWSGFLAALARIRTGRPMLLTEHGIYTNERRIEVVTADWIHVEAVQDSGDALGVLKTLWINLFKSLGRLCYHFADEIYTLFEANRELQLEMGAPREKTHIIPNGVPVASLSRGDVEPVPKSEPFRVGFVGRVVPIKDVKTFLLACHQLQAEAPEARVYIIGPCEEDREYYEECLNLTASLGLENYVVYTGPQNVKAWYPTLDVLVLTSVSEGQPLVILEGYCCNVPCVATDVGSCAELLYGREGEDRQIGAAGFVTPVAAPAETAAAILQLVRNPELKRRQGEAGRRRVERYYDSVQMLDSYHKVYEESIARGGHRVQA
jgi:glycosyltransferase involved in cell wall biosynthesis